MDKKLITELAVSVINSGKATPSQFGNLLESNHVKRCRNIFEILDKRANITEPFYVTCQNLLVSMNQRPTPEDVDNFSKELAEYYQQSKIQVVNNQVNQSSPYFLRN